ncbi:MAG: DUF4395 family protein, partial [Leptospiraceae bacterium]|nr:DUF4395 family protein [Leptospiraceae bacterium]
MKIGFYPEYVNENAARLIASIIVILTTLSMIFPETYLFLLLNIGFIARTLYGPKYS